MLKIKEDKMQELEKFGFLTRPESEYYKFVYEDEYLWVDKFTRVIDVTSPIYECDFEYCKKIIKKLIKADMVEKVEE